MSGRRRARIGTVTSVLGVLATTLLGMPDAAVAAALAECEAAPQIRDVPWAQRLLQPEQVWPFSTGSGITVAVLDSSVDGTHPQLRDRAREPLDYVRQASTECVAHGTAVASIIVAGPASNVGFRGLAPNARILPVRVSDRGPADDNPAVTPADFGRAIREAAKQASVINISLVLSEDYPEVREAIAAAIEEDVVVIAAVGNGHTAENPNTTDRSPYPAAYPGVIGVGAITETGERWPQSQVGTYVDLVAPGAEVLAATPVAGHNYVSGTSYAAPFVAATAALVRAARPSLTGPQVARLLEATASPSAGGPESRQYGAGIVNPYRAVTESLVGGEPAVLPSAPARHVDPAAVARAADWRRTTRTALLTTAVIIAAVLILLVAAAAYRNGRRRGWQPRRASLPAGPSPYPAASDSASPVSSSSAPSSR